MKKFVIALMVISLMAGLANAEKPKEYPGQTVSYIGDGNARQGGEDFATAYVITELPFSDSGTTVGYADDYDLPYSDGADVVYSFTPASDILFSVDLCESSYDTKLAILLEGDPDPVAYNDDSCGAQSSIANVTLTAGVTYYIVVDGYGSSEGDYVIAADGEAIAPPGPGETCELAVAAIAGMNSCPGATFWYTYTATINGYVLIDSCVEGQSVDTMLYVNSDCAGTLIDMNDDGGVCSTYSYASFLAIPVSIGDVIYIEWDSYYTSAPFEFDLFESNGTVATQPTSWDGLKSMYR